jgi:hypothetical protein
MAKLNPKYKKQNFRLRDLSEKLVGKSTREGLQSQTLMLSSKHQVINEKALWEKVIGIELSSPS